jgi:hypothetical protein
MHITAKRAGLLTCLAGAAAILAFTGCDDMLSVSGSDSTVTANRRTLILTGVTKGASYAADIYCYDPEFEMMAEAAMTADFNMVSEAVKLTDKAGGGTATADGATVSMALRAGGGAGAAFKPGPYMVAITETIGTRPATVKYKAVTSFSIDRMVINWETMMAPGLTSFIVSNTDEYAEDADGYDDAEAVAEAEAEAEGGPPAEPFVNTESFAAAISGIIGAAGTSPVLYALAAGEETFVASPMLEMASGSPVSVTLDGSGRTLTGRGARVTVGAGVTLTLRNIRMEQIPLTVDNGGKLVLEEGAFVVGNSGSGVTVKGARKENGVVIGNGFFEMNGGEISANTNGTSLADMFYIENGARPGMAGGGVFVEGGSLSEDGVALDGGRFTMRGGKIMNNRLTGTDTLVAGGGVFVGKSAVFTMNGGEIVNNLAFAAPGQGYVGAAEPRVPATASGGGVAVEGGGFSMSGGKIAENTVGSGDYHVYGGGVAVIGSHIDLTPGDRSDGNWYTSKGIFTMSGRAEISANKAEGQGNAMGGGVFMGDMGDFTAEGGTVRGNSVTGRGTVANTAGSEWSWYEASGGGVAVSYGGKFTMSGGSITENWTDAWVTSGGGIALYGRDGQPGIFDMKGGLISGNTTKYGSRELTGVLPDGRGGGLYAGDYSQFTMSGGTITGNTAYRGGGMYYYAGSDMKTLVNGVPAPADITSAVSNNLTSYIFGNTATADTSSNNVFTWTM